MSRCQDVKEMDITHLLCDVIKQNKSEVDNMHHVTAFIKFYLN